MISINLKSVADRLDKSISDIARETGINRNTITALYHNKVDGIKFSTIEKICATYNVPMTDILVMEPKANALVTTPTLSPLFRQEGELAPFTCEGPYVVAFGGPLPTDFFSSDFTIGYTYYKDEYGFWYWDQKGMEAVSDDTYTRFNRPEKLEALYQVFMQKCAPLMNMFTSLDLGEVRRMQYPELKRFIGQLRMVFRGIWQYSVFIDAFDSGRDHYYIEKTTKQYKLLPDEVNTLITPAELTFSSERLLLLLRLIEPLTHKSISPSKLDTVIQEFIINTPEFTAYRKQFDYYLSNYVVIQHITNESLAAEIKKFIVDPRHFKNEYNKLRLYTAEHAAKIEKIIKKHHLPFNPLFFFNKLTYWREKRKQINLMGIHIQHAIIDNLAARTGIPTRLLLYLTWNEIDAVTKGLLTREQLELRRQGVLFEHDATGMKVYAGPEAQSLKDDLEKRLDTGSTDPMIIYGQVACQGYAQGIARVILSQADFDKLGEGEILVTGMTRPEFIPLMKRCAAIVTNDGGITSHAAIVSRELGKPCIIGTKVATERIKDGDFVEVRAHHGTVRILKQ